MLHLWRPGANRQQRMKRCKVPYIGRLSKSRTARFPSISSIATCSSTIQTFVRSLFTVVSNNGVPPTYRNSSSILNSSQNSMERGVKSREIIVAFAPVGSSTFTFLAFAARNHLLLLYITSVGIIDLVSRYTQRARESAPKARGSASSLKPNKKNTKNKRSCTFYRTTLPSRLSHFESANMTRNAAGGETRRAKTTNACVEPAFMFCIRRYRPIIVSQWHNSVGELVRCTTYPRNMSGEGCVPSCWYAQAEVIAAYSLENYIIVLVTRRPSLSLLVLLLNVTFAAQQHVDAVGQIQIFSVDSTWCGSALVD